MPEMLSLNLEPSAVGNYSWMQREKLWWQCCFWMEVQEIGVLGCCKSSCLRWAALSSALARPGDTSIGFKVGKGYFIINDKKNYCSPYASHAMQKCPCRGRNTFFFLVLAFFLHLWEASDLLEPLLVASELPELGFSASMVLLLWCFSSTSCLMESVF